MGDSVDNVPGVPGVGQVTAKKWISAYGDLDTLLAKAEEIKGKVGESLREHKEAAILSRTPRHDPDRPPDPLRAGRLRADRPRRPEAARPFRRARVPLARRGARRRGRRAAGDLDGPAGRGRSVHGAGEGPFAAAMLRAREKVLLASPDRKASRSPRKPRRRSSSAGSASTGRAAGSPSPTPSRSTRCSSAPARRSRATSSTSASLSTSSRRESEAPSSRRWRSSGWASASPRTRRPASSRARSRKATRSRPPTAGSPSGPRAPATSPARLEPELAAHPELEKIYREIERPLTPVLARMEIAGVAIDSPLLKDDVRADGEGSARPRAEDLGRGRRGVQHQLPRQARPDPLREARLPGPEEDGEDALVLDRRRGVDRSGGAGISRAALDARVPRDREAQGDLRGRPPGARGRGAAASTPPSARPSPRPAGSPPPTRTSRTSRSAPRRAARSGGRSSRRRAAGSSSPITRRSSCGCSRISPATRT